MNHPLGFDEADFAMFHEVVRQEFIVTADNDYLAARILALSGLPRQFCWMANQAMEKYVKALTLLTGERLFFSHNWNSKLNSLGRLYEFPKDISYDRFSEMVTVGFDTAANEIHSFGDANLRYSGKAIVDSSLVAMLDCLVDILRRNFFLNPWERSEKGLQYLRDKPGTYFKGAFPFHFDETQLRNLSLENAFRHNNTTFFGSQSDEEITYFLNATSPTLNYNLSEREGQHFRILHIFDTLVDRPTKNDPVPSFRNLLRGRADAEPKS